MKKYPRLKRRAKRVVESWEICLECLWTFYSTYSASCFLSIFFVSLALPSLFAIFLWIAQLSSSGKMHFWTFASSLPLALLIWRNLDGLVCFSIRTARRVLFFFSSSLGPPFSCQDSSSAWRPASKNQHGYANLGLARTARKDGKFFSSTKSAQRLLDIGFWYLESSFITWPDLPGSIQAVLRDAMRATCSLLWDFIPSIIQCECCVLIDLPLLNVCVVNELSPAMTLTDAQEFFQQYSDAADKLIFLKERLKNVADIRDVCVPSHRLECQFLSYWPRHITALHALHRMAGRNEAGANWWTRRSTAEA